MLLLLLIFFIWLHWVLAAACRIFSCSMGTLSCSMWDVVLWLGIVPKTPALEGRWHLNTGLPGKSLLPAVFWKILSVLGLWICCVSASTFPHPLPSLLMAYLDHAAPCSNLFSSRKPLLTTLPKIETLILLHVLLSDILCGFFVLFCFVFCPQVDCRICESRKLILHLINLPPGLEAVPGTQ